MDKEVVLYGPENEIAFRLNYKPEVEPFISINMNWVSKPHFSSDISEVFGYIYANVGKEITTSDIKRDLNIELKKGIDDILRDLGFKGDLAKIFFKKMTNNSVHFTNPVFHHDLKMLNIDYMEIWRLLHTPKRKKLVFRGPF